MKRSRPSSPSVPTRAAQKPASAAERLAAIQADVIACQLCPRLRHYCEKVAQEKRRAFANETYWGRPVPAWGDPEARIVLVGLAPAAHGANRTGRMFTGDRSGDFLYAALYRAGLANRPASQHAGDGLKLRNVWITAPVRCAPPGNKPLPSEFAACRPYMTRELEVLQPTLRVIVALGRLGHDQVLEAWRSLGWTGRKAAFPFAHGRVHAGYQGVHLVDCFHPSQQNTFTGRLTAAMLDDVLAIAVVQAGLRRRRT